MTDNAKMTTPTGNRALSYNAAPTPDEPFPALDESTQNVDSRPGAAPVGPAPQHVVDSNAANASPTESTIAARLRGASGRILNARVPVGMWDATGSYASAAPTLADIRKGSYGTDGWDEEVQRQHRAHQASVSSAKSGHRESNPLSHLRKGSDQSMPAATPPTATPQYENTPTTPLAPAVSTISEGDDAESRPSGAFASKDVKLGGDAVNGKTEPFDNGYVFPPKHSWSESTVIGLKSFWKFFLTPIGFFVTLFGLNVVAWGGMLFLLICNAAPAMCNPTCNDINSPRRLWIEYNSQIVNALFSVTGFGLIPWRFRDLYYLMKWTHKHDMLALRRLAGYHRGWFRLAGSAELPTAIGPQNVEVERTLIEEESIPYPVTSIPDAPLTGVRAPPTKVWKLHFVIWAYVGNTVFQAGLSGTMWGLNRFDRPAWTTGLLVALACIVAAAGGIMVFIEGKKIKAIEGVPVSKYDQEKLARDKEQGIVHFNNLKDEKPKPKKEKKEGGLFKRSSKASD